ncbi:MAG TPA: hypothetical protein VHU18_07440 [Rhizomicrobium sp.]|jgi:hypothetical protein|nr:hypothetical protein [Rhizomicrobium sp.]
MVSGRLAMVAAALLLSSAAAQADVDISAKPTANMSCTDGVCTATAKGANLNVNDLTNMLAAGDATVKTGRGAITIQVQEGFSWTGSTRLTLDANHTVGFHQPVIVAGNGALTIITNDGGSGGDLLFENKGSVTFWDLGSSLVINSQSYMLVNGIATLAADIAANPSGFYALANSYDAKHDRFDKVPIPTTFEGTFESLGQTISHLKIKHDLKTLEGFFASIDAKGIVRDVHLKNVEVRSSSARASTGTLVGTNLGLIANVTADGSVEGSANSMGGIAGTNAGTMVNTSAAVNVIGNELAGGLVGDSRYGTITNSHTSGNVFGNVAGGLVGNGANIILSSATGSVTGGDSASVGGLAGVGEYIYQSYATGAVVVGNNNARVGGLAGDGEGISNSYATGSVTGGSHKGEIGGFAGEAFMITQSYSIGAVGGGGGSAVGGFIGKSGGRGNQQDYWNVETSGTSQGCGRGGDCSGLIGLTSDQLRSQLPAGFDPKIWGQDANINGGFPYLLALPPN